jgi:hypothetical protein
MKPNQKLTRVFDVLIIVSVVIFLVGSISRIQHWAFGKEISMISLGIIILLVGIKHYQKPEKNYLDSIGLLIVFLLIGVQLNKLTHSTKMIGFFGLLLLLSAIWVVLYTISLIRKNPKFRMTTSNVILIAGIGCLIGEMALHFKHLGIYSLTFFLVGVLLILAGLIIHFSNQLRDARKNNE